MQEINSVFNFRLKEFVEKNIEGFNPENPSDLIRAEKILKAESRINKEFDINEIDEFLAELKNSAFTISKLQKLPAINELLEEKLPKVINKPINFGEIFSDNEIESAKKILHHPISNYFAIAAEKGLYTDLKYFISIYSDVISFENLENLKVIFDNKCLIIFNLIGKKEGLLRIEKEFGYAANPEFYKFLSFLDLARYSVQIDGIILKSTELEVMNKIESAVQSNVYQAITNFEGLNESVRKMIISSVISERTANRSLPRVILRLMQNFVNYSQKLWLILIISLVIQFANYVWLVNLWTHSVESIIYAVIFLLCIIYWWNNFIIIFKFNERTQIIRQFGRISMAILFLHLNTIPIFYLICYILFVIL